MTFSLEMHALANTAHRQTIREVIFIFGLYNISESANVCFWTDRFDYKCKNLEIYIQVFKGEMTLKEGISRICLGKKAVKSNIRQVNIPVWGGFIFAIN